MLHLHATGSATADSTLVQTQSKQVNQASPVVDEVNTNIACSKMHRWTQVTHMLCIKASKQLVHKQICLPASHAVLKSFGVSGNSWSKNLQISRDSFILLSPQSKVGTCRHCKRITILGLRACSEASLSATRKLTLAVLQGLIKSFSMNRHPWYSYDRPLCARAKRTRQTKGLKLQSALSPASSQSFSCLGAMTSKLRMLLKRSSVADEVVGCSFKGWS